ASRTRDGCVASCGRYCVTRCCRLAFMRAASCRGRSSNGWSPSTIRVAWITGSASGISSGSSSGSRPSSTEAIPGGAEQAAIFGGEAEAEQGAAVADGPGDDDERDAERGRVDLSAGAELGGEHDRARDERLQRRPAEGEHLRRDAH